MPTGIDCYTDDPNAPPCETGCGWVQDNNKYRDDCTRHIHNPVTCPTNGCRTWTEKDRDKLAERQHKDAVNQAEAERIDQARLTFQLTPTGLSGLGFLGLSEAEWADLFRQAAGEANAAQWALGDLWTHAENRNYGSREPIAQQAGLRPGTLSNYASLCRAFPHERRRSELSISHHAAVAVVSAKEQDALLDEAIEKHLTVAKLRERVDAIELGIEASALRELPGPAAETGATAPAPGTARVQVDRWLTKLDILNGEAPSPAVLKAAAQGASDEELAQWAGILRRTAELIEKVRQPEQSAHAAVKIPEPANGRDS